MIYGGLVLFKALELNKGSLNGILTGNWSQSEPLKVQRWSFFEGPPPPPSFLSTREIVSVWLLVETAQSSMLLMNYCMINNAFSNTQRMSLFPFYVSVFRLSVHLCECITVQIGHKDSLAHTKMS